MTSVTITLRTSEAITSMNSFTMIDDRYDRLPRPGFQMLLHDWIKLRKKFYATQKISIMFRSYGVIISTKRQSANSKEFNDSNYPAQYLFLSLDFSVQLCVNEIGCLTTTTYIIMDVLLMFCTSFVRSQSLVGNTPHTDAIRL